MNNISNVIVFMMMSLLSTTSLANNNAYNKCEAEILKSRPYGINAKVEKVEPKETNKHIIYFWPAFGGKDYLVVTTPEGGISVSIGECRYSKSLKKVVALMIYDEHIISNNHSILKNINNIDNVNRNVMNQMISNQFGLTEKELSLLMKYRYGKRTKYIDVRLFNKDLEEDLRRLEDKGWLTLATRKGADGQLTNIMTIPADIAKALYKKLK